MEILSTGEKIKRARIYKGYTLKDICEDKISVSKMSCIENGKVKAEDWVLDFISPKLQLDIKYLKNDIKEQISNNIKMLDASEKDTYEENLEYNLRYAEKYQYFEIAFEIMHMIFNYNIENYNFDKIKSLIHKYYELGLKCKLGEKQLIYFIDIARYFYKSEEYFEAANYYNTVRKMAVTYENQKEILSEAVLKETSCYIALEEYSRAYELETELVKLIDEFKDKLMKAEAYKVLAILSLRMNNGSFKKYEKLSYEFYKDNDILKAQAIYDYAVVMFDIKLKDKAVEYIKKALNFHADENKEDILRLTVESISVLISNDIYNEAEEMIDQIINNAIYLNEAKYIERAYYYKALVCAKNNNTSFEEMYMNLSLDALMKFANKKEIYNRYMIMGEMYYNMNNTSESIKYFNLAIKLKKQL